MPVVPNALEKLLLLKLNLGPAPILDAVASAGFRALHLGVKVGVFDALGRSPATVDEVAARVGADREALRALLDGLVADGYLRAPGGRYALTGAARKWLLSDARVPMGDVVRLYGEVIFPFWDAYGEEAIRKGAPPMNVYAWMGDRAEPWRLMQSAFRAFAALTADEVATRLRPEGRGRLLDLGGGHGLYAARLAARAPGWTGAVLDHPRALEAAKETMAREGVADRVALRGGDFLEDDLGTGHDLVLAFNVVHGLAPEENARLLARAAAALGPGGRVAILDQLGAPLPGSAARAISTLFPQGLNYRVTLGARNYGADEVAAWLRGAGLPRVEKRQLRSAPGMVLLVASRG